MRNITSRICDAFQSRRSLKIDNSRTDGTSLWLFDNKIAEWRAGVLCITTAGYNTNTTRERLNGLRGVRVQKSRGKLYLNGTLWDGDWIAFSSLFDMIVGDDNDTQVDTEPEFDVTSEWVKDGYSKPIYSVYHTNEVFSISFVEDILRHNNIPFKRMESDTAGMYKPNYFVVVRPDDFENSLITIKQHLK